MFNRLTVPSAVPQSPNSPASIRCNPIRLEPVPRGLDSPPLEDEANTVSDDFSRVCLTHLDTNRVSIGVRVLVQASRVSVVGTFACY